MKTDVVLGLLLKRLMLFFQGGQYMRIRALFCFISDKPLKAFLRPPVVPPVTTSVAKSRNKILRVITRKTQHRTNMIGWEQLLINVAKQFITSCLKAETWGHLISSFGQGHQWGTVVAAECQSRWHVGYKWVELVFQDFNNQTIRNSQCTQLMLPMFPVCDFIASVSD